METIRTGCGLAGTSRRRGFTLTEVVIASAILVVVMLSIFGLVQRDSQLAQSTLGISVAEMKAQQMLRTIEGELADARGANPIAALAADLAPDEAGAIEVDSTLGFPDQGLLLLGRGSASEERVSYSSLGAGLISFVGLTRGQQCTDTGAHPRGSELIWAALAEPIELQDDPPPMLWDGVAMEPMGPLFFRGDGTGFSYRSPVDPTGSTPPNYLNGDDLMWGAEIGGVGTLDGWAALVFERSLSVSEAACGEDLNNDGDELDLFDVGQIRRRIWNTAEPGADPFLLGLGPRNIIQEQCNWGGDLDGDGFDDPIFLWDKQARRLHVRLFVIGRTVANIPIVRRVESMIFLRNVALN